MKITAAQIVVTKNIREDSRTIRDFDIPLSKAR
jgi:hypothetical protein